MTWMYCARVLLPLVMLYVIIAQASVPLDSLAFLAGLVALLTLGFYFTPEQQRAYEQISQSEWISVNSALPPEGVKVVVIHADSAVPCVGLWKRVENDGVFWTFPGVMTARHKALFWADCIPPNTPRRTC